MRFFWRLFHQAILLGIVVSLASCGGKKEESDLSVVVAGESYILPGTSKNCTEKLNPPNDGSVVTGSVQSPRIEFRSATLYWDSSNILDVIAIQIKIENNKISGGTYTCTIEGDELNSLFNPGAANSVSEQNTYLNGRIKSRTGKNNNIPFTNITNETCRVSCSSLVIDDKFSSKDFVLEGTLKVIATQTLSDNTELPVRAETKVKVNHFSN